MERTITLAVLGALAFVLILVWIADAGQGHANND